MAQMGFDLAAMAFHGLGRDPQQAVVFARRYGLLWHGPDLLGTGTCREFLADWWVAAEKLSTLLLLSVWLGEAVREGSAAPVRRRFEGLGMPLQE